MESNFECELCNKKYKSYQSLWNHNKKIHQDKHINITKKERNYSCPNCQKKFTRKDSLTNHIKDTCKNHTQEIKNEIIELKKKIEILENENKIMKCTNTKNINSCNINSNNKITNYFYINKTGNENILELNDSEINEVFDKEISGVVTLIKFINFNERLPNNHSFCTKSLEGKYLLTYNTDDSKIESTRKKYFYQELLENGIDKIEKLYKLRKNKLPKNKQNQMEDTINRLKEIKNSDFSNKILKEIKNKLIELSYNKREIVLNTWNNPNHKTTGSLEDNDKLLTKYLEELANCDTGKNDNNLINNNKDYETDSETSTDSESSIDDNTHKKHHNILSRKKNKKIIV
jgi:hypothetical protein